ncbi:hypothetical protein SETIT_8G015400v2 [Setaria italica]|uniref:Sororin C-terminal region domain-containing protein n=1 Tax=Setaria italica TaxID=4555 RepID=K3ZNB1_SETIT|nr:proteoglycan 4 [Setaria italica]RCV36860.1 hypothetical protein SETIT_8G015400v2 [Setaria italica]
MRPHTSTPGPPGSPTPNSGAVKRQRKAAAPLGDVTNLLLPETPTPIKPRRTGLRPIPTPSDASAVSSTCSLSSAASVTPAPKLSSAVGFDEERSVVKCPIATVYWRRGTAETRGSRMRRRNPTTTTNSNKGKEPVAAAGTSSCPPLGRATRKNSRKDSMAQDTRPISSSAPCHGAKKKRPPPSTPKLPEDFVKRQRAYFADVDAFELPEEEVSESELE